MNHRLLEDDLREFAQEHGLVGRGLPELFARLVTDCALLQHAAGPVPLEGVYVDGGQDTGIDAIAILVNGHVITSLQDFDALARGAQCLEVRFVFVQAKSAAKFKADQIGSFITGVRDFLSPDPVLPASDGIVALRAVKDHVYRHAIRFSRRPTCDLYYATTGKWTGDPHLDGRISADLRPLRDLETYGGIEFHPLGAEQTRALYRQLQHTIEREFVFERHAALPPIPGVREAYLGVVPISEFIGLITDAGGQLRQALFRSHVRGFLGSNPVNQEISRTLGDPEASAALALLSNGVTIAADRLVRDGATFRVAGYEILSGCQTCHLLHANQALLADGVQVPLRLIVTEDQGRRRQVARAANLQTGVKAEALDALSEFHKTLEALYESLDDDPGRRLYLERRPKQFAGTQVPSAQIVTLAHQARAFLSMFLGEPHLAHRQYGQITEACSGRMFVPAHSPLPYYAAALALARVDALFGTQALPAEFQPFRYHLLLLLRRKVCGKGEFPLVGEPAEDQARKLCDALWDPSCHHKSLRPCVDRLRSKLGTFTGAQAQAHRSPEFTSHLIS